MDKDLLFKYIEGDCTEQEKIIVTNWINSDPANMKEYLSLRKLYDITFWQPVPRHRHEAGRPKPGRRVLTEVLKIAAILIFAVLLVRFFMLSSANNRATAMQILKVPAGQRAEITLADGTHVWLNAQSTLTFPNQFIGGVREVKLDGEGYFDVTHNGKAPFIVRTLQYNVKVWGTEFNISAYSNSGFFETALFKGSVEIFQGNNDRGGVKIKPNERVFAKNSHLTKGQIKTTDPFSWRNGIINFDNEPFAEIAKKLELYFDVHIEIDNKNILKYRCTGKFRISDGVEHVLKVLQTGNNFGYSINDKRNTIRIK